MTNKTIDDYKKEMNEEIEKKREIKPILLRLINYRTDKKFETSDFCYVQNFTGFDLKMRLDDIQFVKSVLNDSIFQDCYEIEHGNVGNFYITYTKGFRKLMEVFINGE